VPPFLIVDTTIVKSIHITCVMLSFSLFFLRGVWMLRDSPTLRLRWVRIVPHTVDSVLLASAIMLAWQLGYSPLTHSWLAAKIVALLLYIAIGTYALKRGKTKRIRLIAWLAAQAVFLYIVSVAVTHNTTPWNNL
jgi:uncharacterized membrane protein SirB2